MLGLVFIYFIWKYFADMAEVYKKNKWSWGITAVVFYYGIQLLIGIALGAFYVYQGTEIGTGEELVITLLGLLVSIGLTVALYYMLKNKWQREAIRFREGDILD